MKLLQRKFALKYGAVMKSLTADWGAKVTSDVLSPNNLLVYADWTTPYHLAATLRILVDGDGLEIATYLNGRPIHSGQTSAWDDSPSKLRTDLDDIKNQLDGIDQPPPQP